MVLPSNKSVNYQHTSRFMKYNDTARLNTPGSVDWICDIQRHSHSVLSTHLWSSPCSNLPHFHGTTQTLVLWLIPKLSQCYSWDLENPSPSLHFSSTFLEQLSSSPFPHLPLVTQSTGWSFYSHHLSQLPLPWIPRSKWLFPGMIVSLRWLFLVSLLSITFSMWT